VDENLEHAAIKAMRPGIACPVIKNMGARLASLVEMGELNPSLFVYVRSTPF
jgi:hypothetical protein